ncbi:L-rhamnono-gamma-lactonase [Cladophialophora carrionii]|uniref:L-rhamnono-gamma-lactonase n=1 Tax=Cladophialophora carrionii TaxID=86049 RepID=A0A1C1C799_9EURO|nr:L-rhamnono-gamma-lactonase [Cladophialophora carrionii]
MASQDDNGTRPLSIVDSHIHLYAASHIPSLNWTADLPEQHRLNRQNSVDQYRAATAQHSDRLLGFVFLETDRKSGLKETEWTDALEEVDFLLRIARGTPREGDGHHPDDGKLVLGIVPWGPVPAGERELGDYVQRVRQHAGDKWDLIKGFRYLVQDKPAGVMLDPQFIKGLQWLGSQNLTFDLGVDARSGGLGQLEEACEMMDQVYPVGSSSTVRIIINHFCKPNLRLPAAEALQGHTDFVSWSKCIERMAGHQHTYMKLSGFFSELPEQEEKSPTDIAALAARTKPWVDVVFRAFGPSRIMFGSDWPVCNVGGPGTAKSWHHWHDLVDEILAAQNLTRDEKARVWSGTAVAAYNIRL